MLVSKYPLLLKRSALTFAIEWILFACFALASPKAIPFFCFTKTFLPVGLFYVMTFGDVKAKEWACTLFASFPCTGSTADRTRWMWDEKGEGLLGALPLSEITGA
jgi:hypothetical protein